jgi:uncharacterized membrane protein YdjX (TVP38/TMEM64 family)
MGKNSHRCTLCIILAFILVWTVFLLIYTPQKLVEVMGVTNGYIVLFLSTFFGGIATLTFASVYPQFIALTIGGLNPILAGIIGGIGLTFANSLFFLFGARGRHVAKESSAFRRFSRAFVKWINKQPEWAVPIFVFVYVGFTPFPNNLLTASGGFFDYSFRKIAVPLLLGNMALLTIFAYLGSIGIQILG